MSAPKRRAHALRLPGAHPFETWRAHPMRRTTDRVEAWGRSLLLLLAVLGLPAAVWAAGMATYDASMRLVHEQSAERYETDARVLRTEEGVTGDGKRTATVRWTDENGAEHTARTLVAPHLDEDDTVQLWADRDGHVTTPPMTRLTAVSNGLVVGAAAGVGTAAVLWALHAGLRRALDRARCARWDAEWASVEPDWSARYRT
jgi:hypothetical protein